MHAFTPIPATVGGILLGVSASLLLFANGRILGVSGIVGDVVAPRSGDRAWRVAFLLGIAMGAIDLDRSLLAFAREQSVPIAVVSGVLVGIGTRLGTGCTSGHGLCGIARLSRRSIVATCVFMATGAATVFVMRHVLHLVSGAS